MKKKITLQDLADYHASMKPKRDSLASAIGKLNVNLKPYEDDDFMVKKELHPQVRRALSGMGYDV